tara:strand:+ start:621 stop:1202 length:582 start_codon:yes stop_codon:yes gene_type:complete
VNQILKKLLTRKPIFLLPLIGLGFIFNANSSSANLKDQYRNQKECTPNTADYRSVNDYGGDNYAFYCINQKTKEIASIHGSYDGTKIYNKTRIVGYLGKKVNYQSPWGFDKMKVVEFEDSGYNLIMYECEAYEPYSLKCRTRVESYIYAEKFKTREEMDSQYNRLLNEYNNLSSRDKETYKDFYMKELNKLKN